MHPRPQTVTAPQAAAVKAEAPPPARASPKRRRAINPTHIDMAAWSRPGHRLIDMPVTVVLRQGST